VANLLKRIEALESTKSDSVDEGLKKLGTYGLRRKTDFDKYIAMSMADDLVVTARGAKHNQAPFLATAALALRERFDKPVGLFQQYFLALFGDKDYSKVLDSLAKVDKTQKAKQPEEKQAAKVSQEEAMAKTPKPPMVCYHCGTPGHISSFCFRKRTAYPSRGRFSPYPRGGRGRGGRM